MQVYPNVKHVTALLALFGNSVDIDIKLYPLLRFVNNRNFDMESFEFMYTYNSSIHSPSSTTVKFSVVTTWTSPAAKPSNRHNNKNSFSHLPHSVTAIIASHTRVTTLSCLCWSFEHGLQNVDACCLLTGMMTTPCRRIYRLPYLLSASLFLLVLHIFIVRLWRHLFSIDDQSLCQWV